MTVDIYTTKQQVFEALLDEYVDMLDHEFGIGDDEYEVVRENWRARWNAAETLA